MYKIRLKKIGNKKNSNFLITEINNKKSNSCGIFYRNGYFNSKENLGNIKLNQILRNINQGILISNRVAKYLYKIIKQYNK
jgi:ribosomal protein S16